MRKLSVLIVSLLALMPARATAQISGIAGYLFVGRSTVAAMPAANTVVRGLWIVTDASTTSTCATGGGANVVVCVDQGSTWTALVSSGGGAPAAHALTHQNAGADEISVAGLSGLLATAQTPAAHAHAAVDTTSGTFADALIAASSVTQHETALEAVLDLPDLQGAVTDAQVPDTITVSLAAAATALANNPAPCDVGDFVTDVAADGTLTCDTPAGGGTPGGADTQVQFNDGGVFGGDAGVTYNKTTDHLDVVGGISFGNPGSGSFPQLGACGNEFCIGARRSFAYEFYACEQNNCSANQTRYAQAAIQVNYATNFSISAGGATGHVVIGTSGGAPAIRLTQAASPPIACNATHEAASYYDSTDHDFCDCVGASPAWRSRGGAGTCD